MDLKTFGDAPAAIYLAELLRERNDPILFRKVSRALAETRALINELGKAHLDYDVLSTRSLAKLLTMISERNHGETIKAIAAHDEFIAHLVTNVLEGSVKTWKRRVEVARRKQPHAARTARKGETVECVLAVPLDGEKGPAELKERSKRYLTRKGKKDTLY